MTGLDIEAIRERWERASSETQPLDMHHLAVSAADVPALLAEIKKLREWNAEIKAERDALAQRALHHESELREAGDELRGLTAEHDRLVAELRTAREGR